MASTQENRQWRCAARRLARAFALRRAETNPAETPIRTTHPAVSVFRDPDRRACSDKQLHRSAARHRAAHLYRAPAKNPPASADRAWWLKPGRRADILAARGSVRWFARNRASDN